jgi:HSP20 family protein
LQNQISQAFGNTGAQVQNEAPGLTWAPAVDVYEDEASFVLQVELPGLNKDEVELHVENRVLTISGERKAEKDRAAEGYHIKERTYGRFSRSFTLPPTIDQEKVGASFKDGVLKVVLPKAEAAKPRQIAVQIA